VHYRTRSKKIRISIYVSILVGLSVISIIFFSCNQAQTSSENPISKHTKQLIIVVTESFDSSHASLLRYQRAGQQGDWKIYGGPILAIVGKNGLGWGDGLHSLEKTFKPLKQEGDGKSPAGVFGLSSVFGFTPPEEMTSLKLPYQHIIELVECVDDPNSVYYNTIIHRNDAEQVDWQSSERMWRARLWYDLGVVVDHNRNPSKKNAGSCIFLHNWANPRDSTSGCTAMSPSDMKDIVFWLDESKQPLLVQVPKPIYSIYQESWGLPAIPEVEKFTKKSIDFRAVGNEPGWSLELTKGEYLFLTTNYGRDSYKFKTPPPLINEKSGQTVYKTENQGNRITVIIEDQPCTDTMSGMHFETSVTVILNDQKLTGCGKALH
jgi:D-alanyl-D-alanine dipeptidase